jgi:membrane protease subunit HflK
MQPQPADEPGRASPEPGPATLIARFMSWVSGLLATVGLQGKGRSVFAATVAVAWLLSGIYRVQPDEVGVVLRFGRYADTQEPGLHYHLPYPIDKVLLPRVTEVNQLQINNQIESLPAAGPGAAVPESVGAVKGERAAQMITGDENIVIAEYVVFWRIKDARQFLFNVLDPQDAVRMAAESAMDSVIGRNPIQASLSDKREEIAEQARQLLQRVLDSYQTGILVTRVQLQRVDPPTAVIDAFNDVQRARADQERARNEAEAYANDILPRARGEADRLNQEAQAYKAQVVNLARGEIQSFLSLYDAYRQAKDVTSWRLYLDSMDQLLKKSSKVIVDSSGKGMAGVVPYLPLSATREKAAPEAPAAGGAK